MQRKKSKKVGADAENVSALFTQNADLKIKIDTSWRLQIYMKILFISLGCDKNLVDTEVMLGLLASRGYEMTDDEQEADIIVINTCCFIHDAKEESIQNILEMAELKKEGKVKALIVTGCLAERYKDEILEEIPEVDEVLGTTGSCVVFRFFTSSSSAWKKRACRWSRGVSVSSRGKFCG